MSYAITRLMYGLTRFQAVLQHPQRGATAVEYGLMVALIAVVILGGVTFLGKNVSSLFQGVAGKV
jgi:pilus assembly protein Flp/PilA